MSDSLKRTPFMIDSMDAVDCTMLDRIILRPNDDAQSANMDGETVLLALSTGRYYTLNRVGSIIWEHCTGQNTVRDIHAKLCEGFEVAPELALDDLIALVNQLVQEGLLQQEVKQP
jgi:hypothetical protein